ncbi:MAG TPA: RDD family protein [Dehalococcoidia bacterium]|nr:RDD family protein [Dehalococcoidia bacterium]
MAERLAASRLATAPAGSNDTTDSDRAGHPSRLLAYLLDSLVLFGFTMLFAALAGLNMFLRSNNGEEAITDADQWTSIAIFLGAMPAWLLAMVWLGLKRGQTPGQYVTGLRVVSEDGSAPSLQRLAAYWLALHPLFFHPMFGAGWVLLAWAALLSEAAFVVSLALALLCFVAPLAGLIFALVDPQRRAIHDRLAGLKVVRLE